MFIMTYSQARQNFSLFLDKAKAEGQAIVKRADGSQFKVIPLEDNEKSDSPFAKVKPVILNKNVSMNEILEMLVEGREERADNIISSSSGKTAGSFFNVFNKV